MLDSDGYAELVARRPVLYHRVWGSGEATEASVLEHGLERVASGYTGFWESRPGHVFLKAKQGVPEPKHPHGLPDDACPWSLFAVATVQLERQRFVPDEDCFLTNNFCSGSDEGRLLVRRAEREAKRHRVSFPPSNWLWKWGRYLGCSCPTLAEWADAVGLGSDAQATRATIMDNTTLSYRGVVPASALRLVARGDARPLGV